MSIFITPSDCRRAADAFASLSAQVRAAEIPLLCHAVLLAFSETPEPFSEDIVICRAFLDEARSTIRLICTGALAHPDKLFDQSFALLECLAVLGREVAFRKGPQQVHPAQAELMRYFEQSGHWRQDDGTLVTEYYYREVPRNLPFDSAVNVAS